MLELYRSYADLAEDIACWSQTLPDEIVAVSGIPRSGIIPAMMLAAHRNVSYVPWEILTRGETPWTYGDTRGVNRPDLGIVLVVDDTSFSGRTIVMLRRCLPPRDNGVYYRFGAVYAGPDGQRKVDFWHKELRTVYHTFQWNILQDALSPKIMVDMDGVLCENWNKPDTNDYAASHYEHLQFAKPLLLPSWPIMGVVSSRLEKFRPETEAWLNRHNVQRAFVELHPAATHEERAVMGAWKFKAETYAGNPDVMLFIESEPEDSQQIAIASGKPVLCWKNQKVYR